MWRVQIGRLCLLLVLLGNYSAARLQASEIDGLWALDSYESKAGESDVSGLLLFRDGYFGMFYTMRTAEGIFSGRAHTGAYSVEGQRLNFDVQWWLQDVNALTQLVSARTVRPAIDLQEKQLQILFDSGSEQKLTRQSASAGQADSGGWHLQRSPSAGSSAAVKGLLAMSDGHFVLVYSENEQHAQAYAGRWDNENRQLQVDWQIKLRAGEGGMQQMTVPVLLPYEIKENSLHLQDDAGRFLEFSREAGRH